MPEEVERRQVVVGIAGCCDVRLWLWSGLIGNEDVGGIDDCGVERVIALWRKGLWSRKGDCGKGNGLREVCDRCRDGV